MHGLIGALRAVEWRAAWQTLLEEGLERTPPQPRGGDRWLLRLALLCLIVGLSLYLACGYHAGFLRLNDLAATYPSWAWQCLTVLGDERTVFALTLLFSARYPRVFWTLIVAALIAIAYSRGLKEFFDAMRPPAVLPAERFHLLGPAHERHSFPSGHSVTAAVFFGVLIYHSRWIELRVLWLLLAILVGLSRVAVGVHWPVDVAFGLMGGALAAWLGGRLSARWSGPASNVTLHLIFVLIAAALAFSLLIEDAGYHEAAWMMAVIGLTGLLSAGLQYLWRPLRRSRRSVLPGRRAEP
ncbi:phosphatase PAP2 family protein [Thiorhodococcus mannitoliphagus]|uniref:undecaprenyl-diphosphate phosphatase n=1 Tax=Thiorhodococcus mannitoliphagus TaxID=329406 RepID=A0A6P1DPF2_9GAMM|nr:phosphatase PAP2 family protein [Thiorhodococcus mannitoliphagus]NEX20147.1 phosphatase PAP2 family protein [Thiorhodococcus mannitoliphagus]